MRSWRTLLIEASVALVLLFVLWEGAVRLTGVAPFILPSPSAVFMSAYATAPQFAKRRLRDDHRNADKSRDRRHTRHDDWAAHRLFESVSRLLYPLLGGMQALPMSAFIPIFVVWFGVGPAPKVIAGSLIAFFPVVVNVVTGLRTIEPDLWEMLRVLGSVSGAGFSKIGIPRTLPYFCASLKVAAAGAFIGNVVGEMIASGQGLGYVLVIATTSLNMPLAFAALTILLFLGMILFICFDVLERRAAPWAFRGEG